MNLQPNEFRWVAIVGDGWAGAPIPKTLTIQKKLLTEFRAIAIACDLYHSYRYIQIILISPHSSFIVLKHRSSFIHSHPFNLNSLMPHKAEILLGTMNGKVARQKKTCPDDSMMMGKEKKYRSKTSPIMFSYIQ